MAPLQVPYFLSLSRGPASWLRHYAWLWWFFWPTTSAGHWSGLGYANGPWFQRFLLTDFSFSNLSFQWNLMPLLSPSVPLVDSSLATCSVAALRQNQPAKRPSPARRKKRVSAVWTELRSAKRLPARQSAKKRLQRSAKRPRARRSAQPPNVRPQLRKQLLRASGTPALRPESNQVSCSVL